MRLWSIHPKYVEEGKTKVYYQTLKHHPLFNVVEGDIESWEKLK